MFAVLCWQLIRNACQQAEEGTIVITVLPGAVTVANRVDMRVTQMRVPLKRAAAEVINQEIPSMGGNGGAIALDAQGNVAMPFNTDGMFRGWIAEDGKPHGAIP